MARRKLAGKKAARVAKKSYRTALRMPKKKLAKIYATKMGQTTFVAVSRSKKRRYKRGRR